MLTISKCQNKLYDPDKLTVSSLHTGQTLNTKEITRASKAICSEAMNSEHVQSHYL